MSKSTEGGEKDIDPLHVYSFSTALLVAVMIAWSTLGHKLAGRSKLLGEGSAACLMGLAAGLILLVCEKLFLHPEVLQGILSFDPENFFIFFLPPIIFYAGLSVKKKHFFRNFFTIAGYGVVGTYVCFALISTFLYLFVGHMLTFGDCLALGAILAATDSVAALQVISQDRFPLLYSVVFGEGVLNDATSIVILGTLQELQLDNVKDLTFGVVLRIFGEFLYLAVASSLLGLFFGLFTAFCLRKMHIQHTAQEVALIGLTAYLSYLMGDVLELSGILALFVSAVAISHYALHNISTESRTTTIYSFQTLSYISEGIIFVYCGMDALDPLKWKNTSIKELLWMFWILIILLVVTRAIFVAPVTFLHNRFAQHKLSMREMIVIWWAGLMRGAVSVALVYYYFDPHGTTQDAHTSTMITTTLIVVLISIILFGALTKPLLEKVMGPQVADTGHGGKEGVELAHTPQSPSRRLGGNDYMAVGAELSADHSTEGATEAGPQTTAPAPVLKEQPSGVPVYQDDDFSPLTQAVPARAPSDGLHEVAIDHSPRSMTATAGSPEGKKAQKIMDGLKGMVSRNKPKPAEGNDDFLFEFEALARQKQAAGATGTSGVNLTADSTHAPAARPAPPAGEDRQLLLSGIRSESSGDGYAPDSKALLARITRFWKRIDEGSLQPLFGGPAYQKHNPEHQAKEREKLSSGRSFTVPATSRRF